MVLYEPGTGGYPEQGEERFRGNACAAEMFAGEQVVIIGHQGESAVRTDIRGVYFRAVEVGRVALPAGGVETGADEVGTGEHPFRTPFGDASWLDRGGGQVLHRPLEVVDLEGPVVGEGITTDGG